MINTKEKLLTGIRIKYRFIKTASTELGFESKRDYQRFRNTVIGASANISVIIKLKETFPELDTEKIWSINLDKL